MSTSRTTVVFSDIHWTTAEVEDPRRPLWKRYKRADLFPDHAISDMLSVAADDAEGPIEIVLNGDIFDFDAVDELPPPDVGMEITWWERLRGLAPEEHKSAWKLGRILDDHPVAVQTLRRHLAAGDRVVFVIGNHDIELHWPACQTLLRDRLCSDEGGDLRICAWFYLSEGDTLIEHGNQYDGYCLCTDPLAPLIRLPTTGVARVRLPFGNWASRMMLNGMGLFNPHADSAWRLSFVGYVVFFYQHVARTQPLLLFTWLWSAVGTFTASLRDGLLPAERDVLQLEARVQDVATAANAEPHMVRALHALRVHPSVFRPWMVLRELWLDRALLLLLVVGGSVQLLATANLLVGASPWWGLAILLLLLGPFLFYARTVRSEIHQLERNLRHKVPLAARVTGVRRIVFGHTHRERHVRIDGIEVLNPGTWSPAFEDVACTRPAGRQAVVRIVPDGPTRVARLDEWRTGRLVCLPETSLEPLGLMPLPDEMPVTR